MYVLECELVTRAPLDETFAFFADPYNLAQITPSWLGFRIVTPDVVMRRGAEIDYSFRWLGLPMRWKTEITAYDPPSCFVDEARRSPYSLWRHTHRFNATDEGTVVADRVEYDLPIQPLSGLVHAVAVAPQLRRIFDHRQRVIAECLGGHVRVSPPQIRSLD